MRHVIFRELSFFVAVVFFINGESTTAQSLNPFFKNYTAEDGLPSSEVYQIKQDKYGYIWFATDNGISRFDGNEFENFTPALGLCVKTLFGIYEGKHDRIWFYSFSGEVIYYDYKDREIHCPSFNRLLKEEVRRTKSILNGLFIHKDTLVLYNYVGSVFKLNLDSGYTIIHEPRKNYISVTDYGDNNLVQGVNRRRIGQSFIDFESKNGRDNLKFTKKVYGLEFRDILSSSVQLNDSIYYVASQGKILIVNSISQNLEQIDIGLRTTQSLFVDRNKVLWLGLFSRGVYAFNSFNNKLVNHLLDGYTVTSIFEDKDGGYWFSTREAGVFYCPDLLTRNIRQDISRKEERTIKLLGANDSLVFYMLDPNTICVFDTKSLTTTDHAVKIGISRGPIKGYILKNQILVKNGSTSIFINLDNYGYKLDPDSTRAIVYTKKVRDKLLTLHVSRWKVMLKKGPFAHSKTVFYIHEELQSRYRHYAVTENESFYLGGYDYLAYSDSTLKGEISYVELNHSSDLIISAIEPWKEDLVWVSTQNKGVLLVNKDSVILHFDKDQGLPTNNILNIYYYSNHLYLSTKMGILKLNPWSKKIQIANINSGLPSNEVSKCLMVNHKLYAETNKGICVLDTTIFDKKGVIPKSKIDVEKTVELNQLENNTKLKLAHNFNTFTIYYSAINFQNAFNIPYRYRLKSTDDWTYSERREVTFSNLTNGEYQFEVQAAGVGGLWSNSASLDFVVLKPLWLENWFLTAFFFLLFIIFFLIYKYRIRTIQRMNNLKTSLIHQQNQALSSQMNPHFIFNSLNSISNSVAKNDTKSSILYIGKFGKLMRAIFENSQETFINLSEELEALKAYVEVEKIRLKDKLDFSISIDHKINLKSTYLPALLLQPFVENAIWHGIAPLESNGKIGIDINREQDNVNILIKDNGNGINVDAYKRKKSGIGTTIKRIELIKKLYKRDIKFEIYPIKKDKLIIGTCVLIILPILTDKPNN